MPATTEYWINDQSGDPLFVTTVQANAGMVKMLPEILKQVRAAVGDRQVTIVFDRGGLRLSTAPGLEVWIRRPGGDLPQSAP